MFLVNHDIHSAEELVSVISSLTDKRKEVSAEKSRIYKARERSRELFDIADDMKELNLLRSLSSREMNFLRMSICNGKL